MSETEAETQGGSPAGKIIVLGLPILILMGVGGIGYHHATRNRVRHEAGLDGGQLYAMYCARCHGDDRAGQDDYPSLLTSELDQAAFTQRVHEGKDAMPAFPELTDTECEMLKTYATSSR